MENPIHMIRLIIDIESRFTSHKDMYPTTPTSIDIILNVIQIEHKIFGMKMNEIIIIIIAPMTIHCIDVGRTSSN
jgi:hypothetical protein